MTIICLWVKKIIPQSHIILLLNLILSPNKLLIILLYIMILIYNLICIYDIILSEFFNPPSQSYIS